MPPSPPFQSLSLAGTVSSGISGDMTGASALAATMHSGIVVVTGYSATSQIADVVAQNPFATVQLQVSNDPASPAVDWVPIAAVNFNGNGTYKLGPVAYPARFVRAVVTSIDARITAIGITAYVASAT